MSEPTPRPRKNKKRPLAPTGRLLKALRKASGYTQAEIKLALGFKADSAVSKLESRDFVPDIQRLKKLLHLLRPTDEQTQEILSYFGYTPADLEADFEPARPVRHHQEQHPILNFLQQLFYLYTYQKNYQQVLSLLEERRQNPLVFPEAAAASEKALTQIVQAVFSARRLLAQGALEQRTEDFRDAQQQAEMALVLLDIQTQNQTLPYPMPAWLAQLKLHLLLCIHSALFKQLNQQQQAGDALEQHQALLDKMLQEIMPGLLTVLKQLEELLPAAESQNMQHMYLFVLREQLHLFNNAADAQTTRLLKSTLSLSERAEAPDLGQALQDCLKARPAFFAELYQQVFALSPAHKARWQNLHQQYHEALQAHQRFHSWDAESPELMRAVLNTFLGFAVNLGRLNQIETARIFLDALYLRLNLLETHYHWHDTAASVSALAYLHATQLKPGTSAKGQAALQSLYKHLTAALNYLEQSTLNKEKFLRYTFLEEPVYRLVLLHAQHEKQVLPAALMAQAQSTGWSNTDFST